MTRDTVLAGAIALIERDGLDSFSLRSLAADLGVRPSALYNHVRGRDELLTAVVQTAVQDFDLADDDSEWTDWLSRVAAGLRQWLLGRPQLATLVLQRAGSTAAGPELLRTVTDRLTASGVDPAVAHLAWHVMLTVVVGAVQQDLNARVAGDGTFEAVLQVAIAGLMVSAADPVAESLRDLVHGHGFEAG